MYTKYKGRWIEEQEKLNELNDDDDDEEDEDDKYFQLEKQSVTPLWKRLNKDGFTPLTLAAKLGLADMFSFLLEERKITQWSYGPVSCVLYPLDQVDLEIQEDVKAKFEKFFYVYFCLHSGCSRFANRCSRIARTKCTCRIDHASTYDRFS